MFAHVIAANAGAWLPPDEGSLSSLVLEEKDHKLDEVGAEARPYASNCQPYGIAGLIRKMMTHVRVDKDSSL